MRSELELSNKIVYYNLIRLFQDTLYIIRRQFFFFLHRIFYEYLYIINFMLRCEIYDK